MVRAAAKGAQVMVYLNGVVGWRLLVLFFIFSVSITVRAQVDVLYLYNSNVNQSGTTITDMCAAISLAANQYPGLTLDARGFTGTQYCSAANATTMLSGSTSNSIAGKQSKLLLGNVTMVVDGPSSGNYSDGNGSGVGTPAIIIPNQHWGIQGLSRSATTITFCTGAGAPVSLCTHAFPQRTFTVTKTVLAGNTLRVTVSEALTVDTNIFLGEYVHLTGVANSSPGLPALKVRNVVDSPTNEIDVSVPTGTAECGVAPKPSCSVSKAYLMTPVIGFGPGGPAPAPYRPKGDDSKNSFGQHVKD